ncbi:putative rhamnogalacturonate lyase B [Heracleum sosnowskyi]|uniref:Rhamnogalacturonate lyase B n=1 Tax=Heracleum sosnowskyi TaxID=360622 RepID=A0AAD8MGJ7_9APIA|nr:putative rhamnogalacturonate lyase B [Heracleum sosnowskyi]
MELVQISMEQAQKALGDNHNQTQTKIENLGAQFSHLTSVTEELKANMAEILKWMAKDHQQSSVGEGSGFKGGKNTQNPVISLVNDNEKVHNEGEGSVNPLNLHKKPDIHKHIHKEINTPLNPGSPQNPLVYTIHPQFGPTLWEIGIPDGTAAEFYIPDATLVNKLYINHDKFRQYGLWDRYTDLYPDNDLVYNVGTSNYSKDWFFSQVTRKINDEYHPTTWQINFDLPNVVARGTYTLQLALASTNLAQLRVYINRSPAEGYPLFRVGQIGQDNAIARHGIHGLYWLFNVQIPGQVLIPGRNKILLNHRTGLNPFIGTMYDYIRLEGPPTV